MVKLLNLTIKINDKNKYDKVTPGIISLLDSSRLIEISGLEIKDQDGTVVSEFKNPNGGFGTSRVSVNDIKNIKLNFSVLDIPISWAWKNKGSDTEIEFTLKKLKYDETWGRGLSFGRISSTGTGTAVNTLFLNSDNFDGVEVFESKKTNKPYTYLSQIIELSNRFSNDVKRTLRDFLDLKWKILKAEKDEQITRFISELESWQNASAPSLKHDFYHLKNINGDVEEVKNTCQEILEEIRDDLKEWKEVGIKTLIEVREAKENDFDIITNPSLKKQISPEGKYKGFFIASPEKHEIIINKSNGSKEKITKNRYTKNNIDEFRQFFTKDLDQSDPKYFKGFRPGDIRKNSSGDFVSINHEADAKEKTNSEWKFERSDHTRVYYEFKTFYDTADTKPYDILLVMLKNKFAEMPNKTKKEHLDIYWKWIGMHWPKASKEDGVLNKYYQSLSELLPILENSYVNETKDNCENAFKILKTYEDLKFNPFSGKYQVWFTLCTEIKDKKNEITDRLKVLFDQAIDAATNEDYGSGQLNSERKKIFTTYQNQIDTFVLIEEIQKLIKLLVKGEKLIPGDKWLEKRILLNQLKNEYQNSQGDKKKAYDLTNKVDNQWVDRVITDLEKFEKKDSAILLAERRTQLLTKYDRAMAQAVFNNNVLDSVAALEKAEELLIKVGEAETQNDTNASLLKSLQSYQKAQEGTLKNKAWQAVNSYNQQVEAAIKHLQKNDQSREEIVKIIQDAKSEDELEEAYRKAQNSELYQRGDKSKAIIDNLILRKKSLFQIEQSADISLNNKSLLQIILVKLIPDTIKDDDDEEELSWLEEQLKSFKTASESEEKGKIYQEYRETIEQILTEIDQEKQRYQQTKQTDDRTQMGNDGTTKNPLKTGLPKWAGMLIIMGIIAATGSVLFIVVRTKFQRKKALKNTKTKNYIKG